MRDSMIMNSYLEMKGYYCNTAKGKQEWVSIITTSKARSDEKLGWYNRLGIAHFSQSNMEYCMLLSCHIILLKNLNPVAVT